MFLVGVLSSAVRANVRQNVPDVPAVQPDSVVEFDPSFLEHGGNGMREISLFLEMYPLGPPAPCADEGNPRASHPYWRRMPRHRRLNPRRFGRA